jgi:predicted DNA-binding transcriptional regulator AlpA
MVTGMFRRRPTMTHDDELISPNPRRHGAASTSRNADRLLTTAEVADRLRVSTSFLAKARVTGLGPRFIKIGRSCRYRLSDLDEYERSRARTSTSAR